MTHIQCDEFGNLICPKCGKSCCPVTGTNLAGVCWACVKQWRRQMHEKAQAEIREQERAA